MSLSDCTVYSIMTALAVTSGTTLYCCTGTMGLVAFGVLLFTAWIQRWTWWIYIILKTFPRDFKAAVRFVQVNVEMYRWERNKETLPSLWMKCMEKHPDKIAFYFEDQTWTYRQIEELSNRVGHYFLSQGLKRGDTVALLMETCVPYICVWLGLSKIGIVTALINSNLKKGPLIHSITVANSVAVIYGSSMKDAIVDVVGDLKGAKLYQYNIEENGHLHDQAVDLQKELDVASTKPLLEEIKKLEFKDRMLYIYTSGTTGLPKAANITNLRFMFVGCAAYHLLRLNPKDVVYDPLPLYHTAGGVVGVGQAIIYGVPVAIRKKFSASNYFKDCVKYNCTVAQYIGELCRYLLAVPVRDPSEKTHKIRKMFGNGLRPQIWSAFVERFNIEEICEFYGATEGNSNIVNLDGKVGAVGFKPRWLGDLYPVCLIRYDEVTGAPLRNEDGFCIRCQPEEPGIFVGKIDRKKAITDFEGYSDQTATKKKILTDVFRKGDCYFNSGDILVMDELGYFFFKDRTGDTYRWRGENVATSEVEGVISNVVKLQDAAVYGVEVPNTEGRCGMAAIVDPYNSLDLSSLSEGLSHQLPAYARPLFLRIMKEVPRTGTFKLKKVDLQKEGYDPHQIKDKLYFFDAKRNSYIPLDEALYDDIQTGKIRL